MNTMKQMRGMGFVITVAMLLAGVAPAATVTWTGSANGNWNISSGNWSGGSPTANLYVDGDAVNFNGGANPAIAIAATYTPSSLTFNNPSVNFTFSGGGISGSGALSKAGAGDAIFDSTTAFTGYSGAIGITAGRLLRQQNSGAGSFGSGTITLDGGTLGIKYTGGWSGTTIVNPITVTATGGTIVGLYNDGNTASYTGAMTLNSGSTLNLDASGSAGNAYSLIFGAMTLGGNATIRRNYTDTFLNGGVDGRRAVYLNGAINGAGYTLTVDGVNMRMQSTGALTVSNLVVNKELWVEDRSGNAFVTLGTGGKVTVASGGLLALGYTTLAAADLMLASGAQLRQLYTANWNGPTITGALTVGANRTVWLSQQSNGDTLTFSGGVTFESGSLLMVAPGRRNEVDGYRSAGIAGTARFLGGSTIEGKIPLANGTAVRSGTMVFGDTDSGTAETVTIKGQGAGVMAFVASSATDVGGMTLRYAAATNTSPFKVGWGTTGWNGGVGALTAVFLGGSAATEFAPQVGTGDNGKIIVIGCTNNAVVFTVTKPTAVVSAGTVEFRNSLRSGSDTWLAGNLGAVVITNGGAFTITNAGGCVVATNITVNGGTVSGIGTFAPVDMVFTNGGTCNVVLTGGQTNNCGVLSVTNTLTFAAGSLLTVDTNAYVPAAGQYWYIASAATISGLPTPPADYTVVAEGGTRLKLTKLSSGTAPDIVNLAPSNVLATSATLCGYLNSTGTAATTVSVYWGPTDGGTTAGAWGNTNTFPSPSAPGPLATNVTPLAPNAQYFYRYFASNIGGGTWPAQSEYFITSDVWVNGTLNAAEGGPVTGLLTVSRSPLLTNGNLIVNYIVSGTASNGIDYTSLPGTVTIPAGASNATISVIPFNDALAEGTETVTVTVVAGRYTVGSPSSASIDVADYPAQSLTWSGGVNSNWDSATANWTGGSGVFAYGDQVTFNDASTRTNVSVVGTVTPATMLVTNDARLYTFSSGGIGGAGTLRKAGSGDAIVDSTTSFTGYSGAIGVTGGRLIRQQNGGDGSFGSGTITLDGGTLGIKYTVAEKNTTNTTPITVTATGGTIVGLYQDNDNAYYTGTMTLNSGSTLNLEASGQAGNAYSLILGAMTLGGSATIKRNYDDTFLFGGTDGRRAVYLNGAISGVGHTLTLDSINLRLQSTGSLNVSNLVVMQELWVETHSGAAFVTLGAGGTVRVASNGLLALQSTTLDAAKLVLDDGATLQHMSGSGSSSPTIQNALSVDSNRTVWLGVQAFNDIMAFPSGVTFNAGSRLVVGPGNRSRTDGARAVSFSGTARFLGGSTIEANILQANGTDLRNTGTLVFGDTNAGNAETVTIKGQGTGVLAFAASSVADIGGMTLRYAAATNTAPFKVGWGATGWNTENGSVGALTAAFLGGSAATEFAPQVGTGDNGKIIAIGRTNNATVFTVTNLTTVTTAGTVEFRNSAVSGSDTWLPAGLGGVVITNGATLAFSSNGTVVASNVTFHAGTTLAVALVGTASNAVGYLNVPGTLEFKSGAKIAVSNPAGFNPAQSCWYVGEASSIIGLPTVIGFYNVDVEPGTPQRLRLSISPGTVYLIR